ncbi:histidine phosphatase family protein [Tessaracoccus sp. OS52]|uniref:histidine phosphatase family protein n=1 Tax=Tessaracoccus sp. OS52 TaxID=2886691 RepID=UPI001D116ED3|nr:histidine phosphatase family protein [Tessaracoccus sp. OS52]MCC2594059.1 histidine phosphatase family protein [Tessaracoccus sp. OS52]
MRLILIRHGETQSNVDRLLDTAHPGAPLTEQGVQQAHALAEAIADEEIDAVFVSTLTRAQQTAEPLAQRRNLKATVIDGVHEISAGVEEMSPDWTTYVGLLESWSPDNLDAKLEGGESAREFLHRFDTAIAQIEEQGHRSVAVVSHGAAMRVWAISRDPNWNREHARALHNTEWIVMTGSTADGWRIERWGDHVADVG